MFSFIASIIGIKFIIDHLTEVFLFVAGIIVFIIYIVVRNKKRRAAYLALPVLYIGNKETKTYHSTHCQMLSKSNPSNLVQFRSCDNPTMYGYKPCSLCKP